MHLRNRVVVAALVVAALATSAVAVSPAGAATRVLRVRYRVTGSTHVAKPNSTVQLGPTALKVKIKGTSPNLTARLPIPPAQTSFTEAGAVKVTGTVTFLAVGVVKAVLHSGKRTTVTSTARYTLKLGNVTVAGIPTDVGTSCETIKPVSITVTTPRGKSFNIGSGGHLVGTYTIGDFQNCGALYTPVINNSVPGPGNTVDLKVGKGHLVG